MRHLVKLIFCFLVLALWTVRSSTAQISSMSPSQRINQGSEHIIVNRILTNKVPGLFATDTSLMPQSKNDSIALDSVLTERKIAGVKSEIAGYLYRKAAWNYLTKDLAYRAEVFRWQRESAQMTFAIAVLIVVCGLVFSGIQFRIAMKQATLRQQQLQLLLTNKAAQTDSGQPDAPATGKLDDLLATNLKLSAQGVEVSSSILGVIILVLSLAFFYLYIVYIFPIKETDFNISDQEINTPATSK